jgi:hypothetical protein
MGPKKDNDSSKVKRKNTSIMIDVKKEIIVKHENGVRISDLATGYLLIPFQTITLPLTPSTLLHTGTVKLN